MRLDDLVWLAPLLACQPQVVHHHQGLPGEAQVEDLDLLGLGLLVELGHLAVGLPLTLPRLKRWAFLDLEVELG